jgi:pimeloyl-ACP methyl ester carboxylesterase
MQDYVEDACSVAGQLSARPILLGWSMGGLVALMAAGRTRAAAWVGLEPSVPALTPGEPVENKGGVFGDEEYEITSTDPDDQPAMPELEIEERRTALASLGLESRFARDERQAGIVVRDVRCPLLVVSGNPEYAYAGYGEFPLAHHLARQ